MLRQSVDLCRVEHIGLFQKRNGSGVLLAGTRVLLDLDDLVGVDNRRTFFTLTNMSAHLERGLEPEPVRRTVSLLLSVKPYSQDVNPIVGLTR